MAVVDTVSCVDTTGDFDIMLGVGKLWNGIDLMGVVDTVSCDDPAGDFDIVLGVGKLWVVLVLEWRRRC